MVSKGDRDEADRVFADYCERRIPPKHRDKVRLEYSWRGQVVTIVERHPPLMGKGAWSRVPLAQFRRNASGKWSLYCADRNSRWHAYMGKRPSSLKALLAEVDRDPTGIFWG